MKYFEGRGRDSCEAEMGGQEGVETGFSFSFFLRDGAARHGRLRLSGNWGR